MTRYPSTANTDLGAALGELSLAELYRSEGKDGKSRVCARRAVGFALAARHPGEPRYKIMNAMNLIREARAEPGVTVEIAKCLDEMVARVDENFDLPHEIDLIASARRIIHFYFPMEND